MRDLDRVALTAAAVTDDGDRIEAGRQGTIVGVWREGATYEVEFADPPGASATAATLAARGARTRLSDLPWPSRFSLDPRKVVHHPHAVSLVGVPKGPRPLAGAGRRPADP
ncbi:DUF4926 domain-containing protein [Methylobacterium sp. J-076]|uniref:DUF4926 domain-containing protein n=1 Tax=Methylobacterium sp. J-076 TaxID=2836655 RepID=UPI001FBAA9BA|nr:DUF4926 domain-containing protein [Methylobacterium sp. J-076]